MTDDQLKDIILRIEELEETVEELTKELKSIKKLKEDASSLHPQKQFLKD